MAKAAVSESGKYITVCSAHLKNITTTTSLGSFHFDDEGRCKMDVDDGRAFLKLYRSAGFFRKGEELAAEEAERKSGKVADADHEGVVRKKERDGFDFPANVAISRKARAAMENGELTEDEVMERAESTKSEGPGRTDLMEDLAKSGALAASREGGSIAKKPLAAVPSKKAAKAEDDSEDAPSKPRLKKKKK